MSMETFTKCINKLPSEVEVHFSGFAEPFFNPLCAEMIAYARKVSGKHVQLYTTLMGLKQSDISKLIYADLTFIRVHVPDSVGLVIPDDDWIRQHDLFVTAGLERSYMAMGPLTPRIEEYMRSFYYTVDMPTMLSRGGSVERVASYRREGKLKCAMNRWHNNVLLPNGDVYVCCNDYGLSCKVGNLITEDYPTIWERADAFDKAAAAGNAPEICRLCEWAAPL